MESYHGLILTPRDAMILLEAARVGMIPKTTRRLSEFERSRLIQNGAIFIWDEMESGMKRWTDGKSWSASRVSGSFLIYKEMENTKSFTFYNNQLPLSSSAPSTVASINSAEDSYRYKNNGLIKQSFSITLNNNLKLHLISYVNHNYLKKNYSDQQIDQFDMLKRPTEDYMFRNLKFDPTLYPETILTYQDTVTDFQQVDNSLKSDQSLSLSPTNSSISRRQSSQHQHQLQHPIYQQQQQQQQQLLPPQPPAPPLQQPQHNYRIHSVMADEVVSSPRLPNLQSASHLPPMYQSASSIIPPPPPQQQQQQHLNYLNQQHQQQQEQQQINDRFFLPKQQPLPQKINMPVHHKEDGRYLNLLDRTFSS